jgi:hypothetical protein
MTAPKLDAACFPKLHTGKGKPSAGVVVGTGIDTGHAVTVMSKKTSKVWTGKIGDKVTGSDDTWSAVVYFDHDKERVTETVDVTVTNGSSETSPPVQADPDVVP